MGVDKSLENVYSIIIGMNKKIKKEKKMKKLFENECIEDDFSDLLMHVNSENRKAFCKKWEIVHKKPFDEMLYACEINPKHQKKYSRKKYYFNEEAFDEWYDIQNEFEAGLR
jgi:hypothetical protein